MNPVTRGPTGLQAAFELFEVAVAMVETTYRRGHPGVSDEEVAAHVQRWLLDRPGAPQGDCVGSSRDPASIP